MKARQRYVHQLEVKRARIAAAIAAREAARQRAAAVAAQQRQALTPTYTPSYIAGAHNWDAVAKCESGGDWSTNTGNGYYGGLQFSLSTWQANGGTGLPSDNSRETQIAIAERVLAAVHGNWESQWPVCGRYL